MPQSHQLLEDVDLGMHDNVLQQDDVVEGLALNVLMELGDLDDAHGALTLLDCGDHVLFTDEPFPIEGVLHRLPLYENRLQDGYVLRLRDYVNVVTVGLH